MSNDPLRIKLDKLSDLLRGLGLDPVEPNDIRRITIDADGIEVIRYRRNEEGRLFLGFGEKPLTETITIGYER